MNLFCVTELRGNAELWLPWTSKRRGHWNSKQAEEWGVCLSQDLHYLILSQREPLMP